MPCLFKEIRANIASTMKGIDHQTDMGIAAVIKYIIGTVGSPLAIKSAFIVSPTSHGVSMLLKIIPQNTVLVVGTGCGLVIDFSIFQD